MSDKRDRGSYGQFCPVAMAAEIVCNRWTALVLRELLCGSTRFNDLRRGVPKMSPVWMARFMITSRVPAPAVREFCVTNTSPLN